MPNHQRCLAACLFAFLTIFSFNGSHAAEFSFSEFDVRFADIMINGDVAEVEEVFRELPEIVGVSDDLVDRLNRSRNMRVIIGRSYAALRQVDGHRYWENLSSILSTLAELEQREAEMAVASEIDVVRSALWEAEIGGRPHPDLPAIVSPGGVAVVFQALVILQDSPVRVGVLEFGLDEPSFEVRPAAGELSVEVVDVDLASSFGVSNGPQTTGSVSLIAISSTAGGTEDMVGMVGQALDASTWRRPMLDRQRPVTDAAVCSLDLTGTVFGAQMSVAEPSGAAEFEGISTQISGISGDCSQVSELSVYGEDTCEEKTEAAEDATVDENGVDCRVDVEQTQREEAGQHWRQFLQGADLSTLIVVWERNPGEIYRIGSDSVASLRDVHRAIRMAHLLAGGT